MSAQLKEVLLGHLQATYAHRWPGTDGMTVQDVLLSYPHAIASGQAPDRQELLRRHPDLAAEVEAYFSLDLKSLDALVACLDREVGTSTLTFTGETAGDNPLAAELEAANAGLRGRDLVLDFTNVRRVNSPELGTLVELHKRLMSRGAHLTLVRMDANVREVFAIFNEVTR